MKVKSWHGKCGWLFAFDRHNAVVAKVLPKALILLNFADPSREDDASNMSSIAKLKERRKAELESFRITCLSSNDHDYFSHLAYLVLTRTVPDNQCIVHGLNSQTASQRSILVQDRKAAY